MNIVRNLIGFVVLAMGSFSLLATNVNQEQQEQLSEVYQSNQKSEICYEWIDDQKYLEDIHKGYSENYVEDEPLLKNLRINASEVRDILTYDITNSLKNKLVLVAKSGEEIIGCTIHHDFFDFENQFNTDFYKSEKMKVILKIYEQLTDKFLKENSPIKKKDMFFPGMAYVDKRYRGQGIYSKLVEECLNKATEVGYKYVIADATAKQSQTTLIKKFGFRLENEIIYRDFIYENTRPFTLISDDSSYMLLVKKLRHASDMKATKL